MSGSAHPLAHGVRNAKRLTPKQPSQRTEQRLAPIDEREAERGPTANSVAETIAGGPWEKHVGEDNVTLTLTGELTIVHAAALHKELLLAVAQAHEIRLEMEHVVYLDAAILQLICATRRTADATGAQCSLHHVQQCVIESAQVFGMGSVLTDSSIAEDKRGG
jgi:anti-anti-sigma factor